MAESPVPIAVLEKRIKEILKDADFETTTAKQIRKQLENELRVDLSIAKKAIGNIIKNVINEKEDSDVDDDAKNGVDDGLSEDEKYARKLQKEEAKSSGLRPRTATVKAKTTKRKRKSSDSEGKSEEKKRKSGYMKNCQLSEELAAFVGESELPRHAVVKKIYGYVKENNLHDPKNKQFAICDNELLKIFGQKRVRLFGMMKHLSKHIK